MRTFNPPLPVCTPRDNLVNHIAVAVDDDHGDTRVG